MDISTRRQALALTREIYGAQNQTAILSESPSGCEPESIRTAHEIKFLLDEMQSKSVLGWATDNLTPDAHADPLSRSYRVTSLYFDTRDWSVYYRRGFHKRHKYRVRRYGTEAFGFLERKSRWGSWVSKRRVGIPLSDLNELAQANPRVEWPGYWFHNQSLVRQLEPKLQISYVRMPFVETIKGHPSRLTLDTELYCSNTEGYSFNECAGVPLATGKVILELKYPRSLPEVFQGLLRRLELRQVSISKYRLGVEAVANGRRPQSATSTSAGLMDAGSTTLATQPPLLISS